MIQELKLITVSVRVALEGGDYSTFSRLRGVRVNFPDIGNCPVQYQWGLQRWNDVPMTLGPNAVAQLQEHLSDLTMI